MEWVYIYQDIDTQEIAYVGRSNSPDGCAGRIRAHSNEVWHGANDWRIIFCPCKNRAESEAIETELINRFKPKANKAKVGWGLFLDNDFPIEAYPKVREQLIRHNYASLVGELISIENSIIECAKEQGVDLTA